MLLRHGRHKGPEIETSSRVVRPEFDDEGIKFATVSATSFDPLLKLG